MSDDDETVLVCIRVADLDTPVGGAHQTKCDLCGEKVWCSPSSPKHDKVLCLQCIQDTIEPDAKFEPITDEQWTDVREHFKKHGH